MNTSGPSGPLVYLSHGLVRVLSLMVINNLVCENENICDFKLDQQESSRMITVLLELFSFLMEYLSGLTGVAI